MVDMSEFESISPYNDDEACTALKGIADHKYVAQASKFIFPDEDSSYLGSLLKGLHSIDEFQYGKQGIYMRKGWRSGTFLPQVAYEVNWTKEEFLGHCAQDKAGIGWDGWKTAELYTYEAIVF